MGFKNWYGLIVELKTIYADDGETWRVHGIACDGIDLRFEDWNSGKNLKRVPQSKMPTLSTPIPVKDLMRWDACFSVPIDNGEFVNIIPRNRNPIVGAFYKESTMPALASAFVDTNKSPVTNSPLAARIDQINPNWMFYAAFYKGNQCVKAPEYPRNAYEKKAALRENMDIIKWKPGFLHPSLEIPKNLPVSS